MQSCDRSLQSPPRCEFCLASFCSSWSPFLLPPEEQLYKYSQKYTLWLLLPAPAEQEGGKAVSSCFVAPTSPVLLLFMMKVHGHSSEEPSTSMWLCKGLWSCYGQTAVCFSELSTKDATTLFRFQGVLQLSRMEMELYLHAQIQAHTWLQNTTCMLFFLSLIVRCLSDNIWTGMIGACQWITPQISWC